MGGRVPGVGGGMGGGCGVPPCARTALCRRPGAEPPLRAPRPPDEGGERGGPHRSAPPLFADTGLECPVCKEDYAVAEQVRQLPCNHFFHGGCIVPWLELVSASHGVPRSPTRSPPGRPLSPRSARSTTRARCAGRASAARTPRGTPTAPRRAAAPTAKAGSGGRSDAASAAARRLRRRSAVRSPTAPRAAAPLRNTEPPGAAGGSEPRNGAGRWEGLGAECGRGGGGAAAPGWGRRGGR